MRLTSYCWASFSSVPNAWAVRTDERTSSARVAAAEYSETTLAESLAKYVPPTPKMSSMVGKIQKRMRVNFHDRMNAITNPEKNVDTA